jgi:protein-tyrosine phosphatase
MNKQRSVTAERLYKNDARLEVRSAGVRTGANRRISESDLNWADIVFVLEQEHKQWIKSVVVQFQSSSKAITSSKDQT